MFRTVISVVFDTLKMLMWDYLKTSGLFMTSAAILDDTNQSFFLIFNIEMRENQYVNIHLRPCLNGLLSLLLEDPLSSGSSANEDVWLVSRDVCGLNMSVMLSRP